MKRGESDSANLQVLAAPSATAYGWHLRSLLRAVGDGYKALLYADEQRLLLSQEGVSGAGMDRLARLLQRVDPAASDGDFTGHDVPLLTFGGWCIEQGDGSLRATRRARRLLALVLAVADGGRGEGLSLAVTCGLDGRALLPVALAQTLAGCPIGATQTLPWSNRQALDQWLEAVAERQRVADESAWLRAFGRVSALSGMHCPLLGYSLTADYQWCKRLCEVTDTLPGDPRRLLAVLRALRPVAMSPGLARWQVQRLSSLLPVARLRQRLAAEVVDWSLWTAGEQQRLALRARGERRAKAWPEVPTRKIAAWIDHDAQGGVVADGLRVEMCALRHLHREGWQGIHAEGGFWLGLSALLAWPVICAKLPGVWPGPWQTLPLDWARWGFSQRRALAIDDLARRISLDASACLESAWAAVGDCQAPGWPRFPDLAVARVVCKRVPGLVLARILRRLLGNPREAGGLPDLLCWRGDECVLWEVKSPGDALSDAQRAWLMWFQQEGVHAGVLRVTAQVHRQMNLLDTPPEERAVAADPSLKAPAQRRASQQRGRPRKRPDQFPRCHLLDEEGLRQEVRPGGPVAGHPHLRWSANPHLHVAKWSGVIGAGAVNGWQRPVDAIAFAPVEALRWQGLASLAVQQWLRLPKGWGLPLLIHHEAQAEGGLHPVATMLWRRAGWLVEAEADRYEPVVEPIQDLRQATSGDGYDWEPHPARPAFRPLAIASAGGFGEELQQQLALLGNQPFALEATSDGVALALPRAAACLWISDHPRIQRSELPWRDEI